MELKAKHVVDVYDEYSANPTNEAQVYLKSEADKAIAEITEGAISMFRCSETCRGLDLKSPLGKIANIAFKHWNSVEFIQNENTQLQKDKERLLQNNHHLLGEIERLKEKMERRERHHKYKRCLDKAELCRLEQERIELIENQDITDDDFDKLAKGFYKKMAQALA